MAPFGVPEIVASVAGARSVLDVGCGSARLTLALADAGATQVVGVDTSLDRLTQGRARISTHAVGGRVQLFEADFDRALPFADGRFGAAVSRLALMIASDPVATLRELRRVTAPGERIVTAARASASEPSSARCSAARRCNSSSTAARSDAVSDASKRRT
jgi:ubiquinone/menaquinone biosynthesis C-methylase UbiE